MRAGQRDIIQCCYHFREKTLIKRASMFENWCKCDLRYKLNNWIFYLSTHELTFYTRINQKVSFGNEHEFRRSWIGVYWFHLGRVSVCGQNRVRSVSLTILAGLILYLHILSTNFRKCVVCKAYFKTSKFKLLANSLNLYFWLSCFYLGSNMTQWYG